MAMGKHFLQRVSLSLPSGSICARTMPCACRMSLLFDDGVSNSSRMPLNRRVHAAYVHKSNDEDSLRVPPEMPAFGQPSVSACSICRMRKSLNANVSSCGCDVDR
jgi:hypothetical protein